MMGKQHPLAQLVPAGHAVPPPQVGAVGGQAGGGISPQMRLRILRRLKFSWSGSAALKYRVAAGGGWGSPPASAIMSSARWLAPARKPMTKVRTPSERSRSMAATER